MAIIYSLSRTVSSGVTQIFDPRNIGIVDISCPHLRPGRRSETPHTVIGPRAGRWGYIVFKLVFNCAQVAGLTPRPRHQRREGGKWGIIINRFCFVRGLWTIVIISTLI